MKKKLFIASFAASTVNELEGMITSQKELMEKLTAECKTLTHKLEDTTLKHKYLSQIFYTNCFNFKCCVKQIFEF